MPRDADTTPVTARRWRAALTLLLASAAAVLLIAGAIALTAAQAQAKAPDGWSTHRDPAGFTLLKPAGWQVRAGRPGEIVVAEPRGGAAALVRAQVVPARADLAQWLRSSYAASEPGLPNLRLLKAESREPQLAHAAFDYGGQGFEGRASVTAVRHGDMATLFVAAAPRAEFAHRLPELTRILDSLRFDAGGDGRSGAPQRPRESLQYARWTDPKEQAFSTDLPAGWRTEGGLRRSTWNVRLAFSSTSPDGAMHLFSGDATVPRIFIQPNQTTRSFGGPEGQYSGPDGQMILAFQRAESFGANLARKRFGAQVTGTRPRLDLVEIVRRNPLLQNGDATASAADIEFRLPDGRVGVLTVSTFGTLGGNAAGTWWADGVHGFIAPADRTAVAAGAMARMLTSGRENPSWSAGEREHQVRMGRQFQDYLRWSAALQEKTITQRWQADEARQAGRRDILGGTVRLQDPATGETFEASARERYYFRVQGADRPTAIGTDTDFKPVANVDLTRLLKIGTEVPDR